MWLRNWDEKKTYLGVSGSRYLRNKEASEKLSGPGREKEAQNFMSCLRLGNQEGEAQYRGRKALSHGKQERNS